MIERHSFGGLHFCERFSDETHQIADAETSFDKSSKSKQTKKRKMSNPSVTAKTAKPNMIKLTSYFEPVRETPYLC